MKPTEITPKTSPFPRSRSPYRDKMQRLSDRIKIGLTARNISPEQLATDMYVDEKTVVTWLSGNYDFSFSLICLIEWYLQMPLIDIIPTDTFEGQDNK